MCAPVPASRSAAEDTGGLDQGHAVALVGPFVTDLSTNALRSDGRKAGPLAAALDPSAEASVVAANSFIRIGCVSLAAALLLGVAFRVVTWGDQGRAAVGDANGADEVVFGSRGVRPQDYIVGVAISADGRFVATGTRGGAVTLWTATGEPVRTWQAHAESVHGLSFFRSDPPTVLSAGRGGELRVWSLSAGEPVLRTELRDPGPVMSAAVAPNGKAVAVGSIGRVTVWPLGRDSRAPMAEFAAPPYPINALTFSECSCELAIGNSGDGCARVWRLGDTEPELLNGSREYQVRGLYFTPAGALVVVDTEGNVALANAGESERVAGSLPGAVRQAAFSHDGRRVLLAHMDGTARLTSVPRGR